MSKRKPTHPGLLIRDIIDDLEVTVEAAAKALGVARPTLSKLLNGAAGVSPEMALRLEAVFGSTAEFWLRRQASFDAGQIRERQADITRGLQRLVNDDGGEALSG